MSARPVSNARTGLPYHAGKHNKEYGYSLDSELYTLQARYDAGYITDETLISEVGRDEGTMHERFLNDEVRLQNNDPRPKTK